MNEANSTGSEPNSSATDARRDLPTDSIREAGSTVSRASPPQAPPDAAEIPQALAEHLRYRVLKTLGRGGMSTVYLAEHKVMKRTVALKVIRPELTASPDAVRRFRCEVEAAARLIHPNIVASYDAEQIGDCLFLAMEYVEGIDLLAWLKQHGPLPVAQACDYVRQAALGLAYAHEQGMIHRDLKPHNLMKTASGQVKILDFGLVRMSELLHAGGTVPGMVLGTPDYMAPEQAHDAHQADIRADIYSLGCTLYQLLSGRVPFPGGDIADKIHRQAQEQATPLSQLRSELHPALVRIIDKMMAKDARERFQSAAEVASALEPWCSTELETVAHRWQPTQTGTKASKRIKTGVWLIVSAFSLLVGLAMVLIYFAWHARDNSAGREQPSTPPDGERRRAKLNIELTRDPEGKIWEEKLAQVVEFPGLEDPKTTLEEALVYLAERYDLRFDVDENAFKHESVENVQKIEIAVPPIPKMRQSLADILSVILRRIRVGSGARYQVTRAHIRINTLANVLVTVEETIEEMPLRELLDGLEDKFDCTIASPPELDKKLVKVAATQGVPLLVLVERVGRQAGVGEMGRPGGEPENLMIQGGRGPGKNPIPGNLQ
jgi:serine/threonine protein kinase